MCTTETVRSDLRRFTLLGMAVAGVGLVSALFGCNSSDYRSPTAVQPPATLIDLTGTWTGTYTSNEIGYTPAVLPSTSTFEQDGSRVTGRLGIGSAGYYEFAGNLDGWGYLIGRIYQPGSSQNWWSVDGNATADRMTIRFGSHTWDLRR
jgi:hypothetical protein